MRKAIALFYLVFLQPPALLTWACIIIAFHLVFHLLGWRELTMVLSGTFPPGLPPPEAASRATIYLVSYFAAVLVAPVMILGAGIDLLTGFLQRRFGR